MLLRCINKGSNAAKKMGLNIMPKKLLKKGGLKRKKKTTLDAVVNSDCTGTGSGM